MSKATGANLVVMRFRWQLDFVGLSAEFVGEIAVRVFSSWGWPWWAWCSSDSPQNAPRRIERPDGRERGFKQFQRGQGVAPGGAVKALLATCPRALLRSTLTAPPSAMVRRS